MTWPLRTDIEKPKFICACGWTSYVAKYDLKYHTETHRCKKAEKS